MQKIEELLSWLDGCISGNPFFVYILLGTGLFFTIYLKFPQIRYFKRAIGIVLGKHDSNSAIGDASHFQALATALSGTIGTGNIAGVALAIHLGGPAALFWMMMTAIIGMATKFVEVSLSHKYRDCLPDGTIAGGPMYYMARRLNVTLPSGKTIQTGVWIASVFSVCTLICSFGTGNFPQINSISAAMADSFNIPKFVTGAILTILLGAVIIGGIRRIVKVTGRLVPIMGTLYFIGAIIVVIYNYDNLIPGIVSIFSSAFTGSAAASGFLGATVSFAMVKGVNRGIFSNEAGQGSAPIAHAAARANEPISEGLVALLEPFIDTVIICMLTGTMIIASGVWKEKFENDFQISDIIILNGTEFTDATCEGQQQLRDIVDDRNSTSYIYSGTIDVANGEIISPVSVIHSHSLAENVKLTVGNKPYSGSVTIEQGTPKLGIAGSENRITMSGQSLLHSVPLTIKAFSSSWFGRYGEFIVALSILLFAFSTTISWNYYGDRAIMFLFGEKGILPYRIIFLVGFFIGSFIDTTIVWYISSIGIVFMTVPNLVGILILRKEIKTELNRYERGKNLKVN